MQHVINAAGNLSVGNILSFYLFIYLITHNDNYKLQSILDCAGSSLVC